LATSEPVFNAPRVVLAAIAALCAVHLIREFWLSDASDQTLLLATAFIPARYAGAALPGGDIAKATSFLTHALLHGDFTHLAVNCGWLLAFGAIVARRIDGLRFLLLSALSAVAGAALFLVSNWGLLQPMVGASGAISGLMGAAVRFMFLPTPQRWMRPGGDASDLPPAMTLGELARDSRARMMIGSWLVLNLVFGLLLGHVLSAGGIAWEAHLGGFFAGLLAFPWFDHRARGPVRGNFEADR
jgi:membrane associated rhomboid family serine protease